MHALAGNRLGKRAGAGPFRSGRDGEDRQPPEAQPACGPVEEAPPLRARARSARRAVVALWTPVWRPERIMLWSDLNTVQLALDVTRCDRGRDKM